MIAVYVMPESLTTEQYNKAHPLKLPTPTSTDASTTPALEKKEGSLCMKIWDAQEAYDAFGKFLMPVLQEAGIKPKSQNIMRVVNLEQ